MTTDERFTEAEKLLRQLAEQSKAVFALIEHYKSDFISESDYDYGEICELPMYLNDLADSVECAKNLHDSRERQRRAEALYDEWRADAISRGIYWTSEQQAVYYELACNVYFA